MIAPPSKVSPMSLWDTLVYADSGGDVNALSLASRKHLGWYVPSPAGAIRSMAMHPTLPLFAATGLDRKCHVFELESRTKLATTFLKQRQSALLFSDTARVVPDEGPVR